MGSTRGSLLASLAAVAALAGLVAPAHAALVSITGGTAIGIPASNNTLPAANITAAGGSLWRNGTLNIAAPGVTLTLYDVGSESAWKNQIRLGNTTGAQLRDYELFGAGAGGVNNPFQTVGSVTQNPGVADIEFWRRTSSSYRFQVENGSSPHTLSSGGIASIAFAYLSDANQIVSYATNRILVMLDDGYSSSPDKDYDDYVGILVASVSVSAPVPLPPAAWLLLSGLVGLGFVARRRS